MKISGVTVIIAMIMCLRPAVDLDTNEPDLESKP
jgi:hypothetical protein